MAVPSKVQGQTFIWGGGFHAAVVAATMVECGKKPPVVVEIEATTGGVFARAKMNFRLNSQNGASIQSVVSPGPSRIPSLSPEDSLNRIPNSPYQVDNMSGMVEFPYSQDMAKAIQRTLQACTSEIITNGGYLQFDGRGRIFDATGDLLGTADRIFWAGGMIARPAPEGPSARKVISGFDFLKSPVKDLDRVRIAVVGAGATGATVVEWMLGQGVSAPASMPRSIHWYGGQSMPTDKMLWMSRKHARWAGIGRDMPEGGREGVIRPYPELGYVLPAGEFVLVNDQVYDLVVQCTGFTPNPCPVSQAVEPYTIGNQTLGRWDPAYGKVFVVGAAAGLRLRVDTDPYPSRFPDSADAIFRLAPRTAALAASL